MGNGQYQLSREELSDIARDLGKDPGDLLTFAETTALAEEVRRRERASEQLPEDVLRELFDKIAKDGDRIYFGEVVDAYGALSKQREKKRGRGESFNVVLKKKDKDQELGLEVSLQGAVIRVDDVLGGPALVWNRANPSKKILKGDCITSVNGVSGDGVAMVAALEGRTALNLVFSRAGRQPQEAAQAEGSFDVVLRKAPGNSNVGMDLKARGEVVEILRVTGGLAAAWSRLHPDCRLLPGEHIVSVNGLAGDGKAMLDLVKSQKTLEMTIVSHPSRDFESDDVFGGLGAPPGRAERFNVSLDRSGASTPLGIGVSRDEGQVIFIEAVRSGLVSEWNERNPSEKEVRVGDIIVAVNGISRSAAKMRDEMQAAKKLKLLVERQQPGDFGGRLDGTSPAGARANPAGALEAFGLRGQDKSPAINSSKQFARQHRLRKLLYAWRRAAELLNEYRKDLDEVPGSPLPANERWADTAKSGRRGGKKNQGDDDLDITDLRLADLAADGGSSDGSNDSISPRRRRRQRRGENEAAVALRQPQPVQWSVDEWERHLSAAGVLAPRDDGGAAKIVRMPNVSLADLRAERKRVEQVKLGGRSLAPTEAADPLGYEPALAAVHALRDSMLRIPELMPTRPVRTAEGAELIEARRLLESLRLTSPPPPPRNIAGIGGAPLPPDVLVALGGPMAALLPTQGPLNMSPYSQQWWPSRPAGGMGFPFKSEDRNWL